MKVQISHTPEDREFADKLSDCLFEFGVEPRRDFLKLPDTMQPLDRLDQNLRMYDFFIPVLSPAYMHDKWLQNELLHSIMRERNDKVTFVLPVLAKGCDVPVWLRDQIVDFTHSPFDVAFSQLSASFAERRQLFVVMRFGDARLDSMYSIVIQPLASEFGLSALRIDEVQNSGVITHQILKNIERSVVVLADLTGERPNCYFEAGYAYAIGKDLILTIQKGARIHFDLAGHRFIEWETERDLRDALRQRLTRILEERRLNRPSTA